MPYTPRTWKDDPDHSTPISATELARMEAGIAAGVNHAEDDGSDHAQVAQNTQDIADLQAAGHDPVTGGTGISVTGQQVSNADTGSAAVATHEGTYSHADIGTAAAHTAGDGSDHAQVAANTSAIAGKEPAQPAASQAEAEAGAEEAIRSWSPLRIWQALAAWGATAASVFKGTLTNYRETLHTATTSGATTIDLANGNVQRFVLGGSHQFTMPADPGAYAKSFVLILECATYTPTWNAAPALKWLTSDGAAPTLVTTATLVNVLTFIWDDVDSRWLGFLAGSETA